MTLDNNSNPEMNFAPPGACSEWEPFIMLLAAGEEFPAELQGQWISHVAGCDACSSAFAQERELLSLLSEHRAAPDVNLLASCRASLEDAVDREEEHGWLRRAASYVFPASWLASGPAWSAAALLLAGFSTGLLLGPRVLHRAATPDVQASVSVASSSAAPAGDLAPQSIKSSALSNLDLHTADVAGISVLPSGGDELPQVEVQMREQQPVTVQGTVDDDNVKNVLINILSDGNRFCPDTRMDAIDALSARTNDPQVRTALCHTVHKDKNAAVRLKALEALNGAEPQDIVQQTLLDALVDDQNPGVRVEAINSLRNMVAKGEVTSSDKMLSVLQDRMQNDPSTYIRVQSAAAIRDLGPRGKF
jgi:hypothetical protein